MSFQKFQNNNDPASCRRALDIIGYDSGWGCADYGCEDGPAAVAADQMLLSLSNQGHTAKWRGPLGLKFLGNHKKLKDKESTLPLVIQCLRRLSNHTRHAIENEQIPVVIGGDHSSAIGTWSGIVSAMNAYKNFGLIWVDAHLDCHTYETSHQGKWGGWWHGQPIPALLGFGKKELTDIAMPQPKLAPEHISIIGPHSFEPAEKAFVEKHGIRVFFFEEVMDRGFDTVFKEALLRATNGTRGFGLSIDLDAFRPEDAPGVGSHEDKGLIADNVLPILKSIGLHPQFRALEIAELNPSRDIGGKTAQLLQKIVKNVFMKN